MKIRFQADADFNEDIVAGILRREPRVDFRTAGQAGLRGLDDFQALAMAAKEGRERGGRMGRYDMHNSSRLTE